MASSHADEAHRHACEVRFVLALPSREARAGFLELVEKRRGKPTADRLRDAVRAAWKSREDKDGDTTSDGGGVAAVRPLAAG